MKKVFVVSWLLTVWTTYAIRETGGAAELVKKAAEERLFADSLMAHKVYDSLFKKSAPTGPTRTVVVNDTTIITDLQIEARLIP